ncbi:hypothetical protein V1525DRAFT_344535 [Lipomyces kononenkoae]|uniref:Uncharacterized protein n=1 Tax=Lipomyces kononenkoae TaxID=34357 RepID=A0ACC3T0V5_LIPKO
MDFRTRPVVFFSYLFSLVLRVSVVATQNRHDCSVVLTPTPSSSLLDFDHIAAVTEPITPLPTEFHYPDYLYLSNGFQLLDCSSFPGTSADAQACSSGNIALLSTGGGSMIFGTPDSSLYSNYRYMNLSSLRVTNLEDTDVFVLLQFGPPYAHGGLSLVFPFATYGFVVPKGSTKLLVDALEDAGLTFVQYLYFTCSKGSNSSDSSGPATLVCGSLIADICELTYCASVAFDNIEIVVPHIPQEGTTNTPTPASTGCPATAVTSCVACAPPSASTTMEVLSVWFIITNVDLGYYN